MAQQNDTINELIQMANLSPASLAVMLHDAMKDNDCLSIAVHRAIRGLQFIKIEEFPDEIGNDIDKFTDIINEE